MTNKIINLIKFIGFKFEKSEQRVQIISTEIYKNI